MIYYERKLQFLSCDNRHSQITCFSCRLPLCFYVLVVASISRFPFCDKYQSLFPCLEGYSEGDFSKDNPINYMTPIVSIINCSQFVIGTGYKPSTIYSFRPTSHNNNNLPWQMILIHYHMWIIKKCKKVFREKNQLLFCTCYP